MTFGVWSSGFGTPHQAPRDSSHHLSFRLIFIFIFILGDDDDGDDDDDDDEGLQAYLQAACSYATVLSWYSFSQWSVASLSGRVRGLAVSA